MRIKLFLDGLEVYDCDALMLLCLTGMSGEILQAPKPGAVLTAVVESYVEADGKTMLARLQDSVIVPEVGA